MDICLYSERNPSLGFCLPKPLAASCSGVIADAIEIGANSLSIPDCSPREVRILVEYIQHFGLVEGTPDLVLTSPLKKFFKTYSTTDFAAIASQLRMPDLLASYTAFRNQYVVLQAKTQAGNVPMPISKSKAIARSGTIDNLFLGGFDITDPITLECSTRVLVVVEAFITTYETDDHEWTRFLETHELTDWMKVLIGHGGNQYRNNFAQWTQHIAEILMTATYLEIPELEHICHVALSNEIADLKHGSEVLKKFGIAEMSNEIVDEARKEHPWICERTFALPRSGD